MPVKVKVDGSGEGGREGATSGGGGEGCKVEYIF